MPIGFTLLAAHLLLMVGPWVRRRELLGDGEFDAGQVNPAPPA